MTVDLQKSRFKQQKLSLALVNNCAFQTGVRGRLQKDKKNSRKKRLRKNDKSAVFIFSHWIVSRMVYIFLTIVSFFEMSEIVADYKGLETISNLLDVLLSAEHKRRYFLERWYPLTSIDGHKTNESACIC